MQATEVAMLERNALDRGGAAVEDREESWAQIVATRPSRSEIPPCPPVPFIGADEQLGDLAPDEGSISPRRAVTIAVGLTVIVALGAFLVVGGPNARSGVSPAHVLPGAAEVGRVTLADRTDRDVREPGSGPTQDQSSAGQGNHGPKNDASGKGGKDDPTGGDSGGGGGGGGGGEKSEPLATVNLPVVGPITVEQPEAPPLPDVKEPRLPGVPESPVPEVDLP
jgi:hypothetical protein